MRRHARFACHNADGSTTPFRVEIRPCLTHEQSRPRCEYKAEFEITELHFQPSMGTYPDAPYHRFNDKAAIGDLRLEQVVLPGVVIDARGLADGSPPFTSTPDPRRAPLARRAR